MKERPTLFIGSSSEGLDVAEAIQQNLDRTCETNIWSQGVFGLGSGTLETLVECLPTFDFAILVMTADDLTESRGSVQQTPRDNVLLELGLCIGFLGRKRTFAVYDRTANIKLPSDLAGVSVADYQPQSSGNLQAALGAASTTIKNVIRELGIRPTDQISGSIDQATQFQIIHDLMDPAAEQFIILMHESGTPLQYDGSPVFPGIPYEYAFPSRTAGAGGFSVSKLCRQLPDAQLLHVDLRGNVSLEERGHHFAEWLIMRGFKASWFRSPYGTWGERPADFMGGPSASHRSQSS